MAVRQVRLGELLEAVDERNGDLKYDESHVRGVNTSKEMMPTRSDLMERDLSKFQIVHSGDFFFNHRTSRNGSKLSITFNYTDENIICTEDYVVFRISQLGSNYIVPMWLYIYFNRPEFDRYVIFNSWGSSTEFFNWADLCSISLPLPPLPVQQKYAAVYTAMKANQKAFERGAEDIKRGCEAYIEKLRGEYPEVEIGGYIEEVNSPIGSSSQYTVNDIVGISCTSKEFITTKADTNGLDVSTYKIVPRNALAFNPNTARMGDRIPIALNETDREVLVSSIYPVFKTDTDVLDALYLMLWFSRPEFDRYARFNSWGSAREVFTFDDMCRVRLPLPPLSVQRAVAQMYKVYKARKALAARMAAMIKDVCPVLIRGSIIEGGCGIASEARKGA